MSVLKWLRLRTSGVILVLVLLFCDLIIFSRSHSTFSLSGIMGVEGGSHVSDWQHIYGFPPLLIADAEGMHIQWPWLILFVSILYIICMPIGNGLAAAFAWEKRVVDGEILPGRRWLMQSPAAVLLGVLLATCFVAFIIAINISKSYWGYYLRRPSVDPLVKTIIKVDSFSNLLTEKNARGRYYFVPKSPASIIEEIKLRPEDDEYYFIDQRVLYELQQTGHLLNVEPRPLAAERIAALYPLLEQTGNLYPGEPGYDPMVLRAYALEGNTAVGKNLLIISASGQQESNDHYPHYEFIFDQSTLDQTPQLVSFRHFFYDVAGIEGHEWPAIFLLISMFGCLLTIPLATLGMFIVRAKTASISSQSPILEQSAGSD